MTKRLVIAEKPSVARDIAEALGPSEEHNGGDWYETDDFVISFAVGHLLELVAPEKYDPAWKRWTLSTLPILPETCLHAPRDGKSKQRLALLKRLAKRKDVAGLVNACDAGREGEHIFRTISEYIGVDKPTERLWLNSLTKRAIRTGFETLLPHTELDDLGAAAACRAEADWLIGINATRALTSRLRSFRYDGAWTAGRVQTPTLTMCVERELEIQAHRPRAYWEIQGVFAAPDHEYEAQLRLPKKLAEDDDRSRIFDREAVDRYVARLSALPPGTASEKRKRSQQAPPMPYDLTSLQRATGLTARRTQSIAQALYERHKVLSYPRTDSRHLPKDQRPQLDRNLERLAAVPQLAPVVAAIREKGVQNAGRVFNDARVTDHHAIVPVGTPKLGKLDDQELRVYLMVVSQYLAAFMPPAVWEQVTRKTLVHAEGGDITFHSTGRMLIVPGWQFAFGKEAGHGSSLHELKPASDCPVRTVSHEVTEKATKPRGRLSDAGLLAKMEGCGKEIEDEELSEIMNERGLGTPATRADTIERLIQRRYLAREGKSLRATAKAIRLIETLRRAGSLTLTSPELTGEMEFRLRQVEHGELARSTYMGAVSDDTTSLVEILKGFDFDAMYAEEPDVGPHPGAEGHVIRETAWGFSCDAEGAEPFFIWKDVSGHVVTREEMAELLASEEREIGPLRLFSGGNRRSRSYEAKLALLRLDDEEYAKVPRGKKGKEPSRWTLKIRAENGAATEDEDTPPEEVVDALCKLPDGVEVVETNLRYVDRPHLDGATNRPKAVLPKLVCQRPMTREEATLYFTEGTTGFLDDFISKRGRPFRAKLNLQKSGRHRFEFEPRKKSTKKKGAKKKATKKKSTKKAAEKSAKRASSKTAKKATKRATRKPAKKAAKSAAE